MVPRSAEDAAESGDGEEAEGGADDGDTELEFLELAAVFFVVEGGPEAESGDGEEGEDEVPVVAEGPGGAEEEFGGEGFLGGGEEGFELGNEEDEGGDHDDGAEGGEECGVDEGAHDLGAEFLEPFDEAGEGAEDLLHEGGAFAGLDHGGMEDREDVGVLAERVGEGLTLGDGAADFPEEGLEGGVDGGLDEGVEGAEERDAGAEEVGELGVEHAEVGGLDAPGPGFAVGVGGVALDGEGVEFAFGEGAEGGGLGVGLDGTGGLGPGLGDGGVGEAGHQRAVQRTTSSGVVAPRRVLTQPSSRRRRRPEGLPAATIWWEGARAMMSSEMASLVTRSS